MQFDHDVAVVGGGPAGATVARGLARQGMRVLVIERDRVPRYKSCAGGIPVRTERLLDFPIDDVVEDTVTGIEITYLGRHGFRREAGREIARMVMRDRFDALLLERAREVGAEVLDRAAVRRVRAVGDGFAMETDSGAVTCRYLVGADGANSRVGRDLGLGAGMFVNVALEAEVCAPPAALRRWRGLINLDVGYRPWGYAWVFPKESRLSIGLVLPDGAGRGLRPDLDRYLTRLGLSEARVERLVGHKIPARRGNEPIAGEGALLVGDAAGLTDEFTEEGIYYAVHSGQIAARHILRAHERGGRCLGGYQRAVDRAIMPELRAARIIARLFYWFLHRSPRVTFDVSRRVPYLWNALFRVLRGESTYDRELNRWPFLTAFARTALRAAGP
jgi:geranylgeranyl reductase family protein